MNRREFIKRTSVGFGLLATGAWPRAFALRQPGPSAAIRVAILGANGRGSELATHFVALPGSQVTYVCDPDDRAAAKGVATVEKAGGTRPKSVRDFRRALDDKDVDAVVIAMPDHWHAPAALLALQAGKHVYVEKPCGHNGAEGELLVAAQEKHPRLVIQMGNQRRSSRSVMEAVQAIREGLLGRAYHAKSWYARRRGSIGRGKRVPVPDHLDWELWQGPAPRRPYQDNVVHYDWHWFWNWGTGESCNNGTHEFDVARWALGVEFPERVVSSGARHRYDDDWEFWDIQQISLEFPDRKTIFWEGHSVDDVAQFGTPRGSVIFGDNGHMLIEESRFTVFDHDGKVVKTFGERSTGDATDTVAPTRDLTRGHCQNFLDSIRDGRTPNAEIRGGHRSVLLCHLGNIALRTKRALKIDPQTGHILDDPEAQALWGREYEAGWEPKV